MVMLEGSTVLSAVARRRLQTDGDTPLTQQPLSLDGEEANIKKRRGDATIGNRSRKPTKSKKQRRHPTLELTSSESSEHGETGPTNQFSSLAAYVQPVSDIGRIEELARGRIRAIAAQGKKIFVSGSYRLWVKSGTVTIYGAVLPASEATYRVYAPSSHSVPVVEVLSDTAEVELTSLDEGLRSLARLSRRRLWEAPDGVEAPEGTFSVLGHHFHMQPEVASQRELDISAWKPVLDRVCRPIAGDLPPHGSRILVTGKRSTGVSSFVRCLISSLLTARSDAGQPIRREVLLVDLDPQMSEVTPPGLIAIARIKEPLLGPAFTHPPTVFETMKSHFIGNQGAGLLISRVADAACDLVQTVQEYGRDLPVVIRVPSWMAADEYDAFFRVWEAFRATQVIHMGEISDSTLEALAKGDDVSLQRVTTATLDTRLASNDEQDLRLQSYFHRSGHHRSLLWRDVPLTTMPEARHSLSFSTPENNLATVLLLAPLIDLEDTLDAMLGSICAVVPVAEDYFDQNLRAKVRAETNGLPRLMNSTMASIPAAVSECLGLAYVAEIATEPLKVLIYTPISSPQLQKSNKTVFLLVHTGNRQHRSLGTEWIATEIE